MFFLLPGSLCFLPLDFKGRARDRQGWQSEVPDLQDFAFWLQVFLRLAIWWLISPRLPNTCSEGVLGCFRRVFGVQIPSHKVFGSLGFLLETKYVQVTNWESFPQMEICWLFPNNWKKDYPKNQPGSQKLVGTGDPKKHQKCVIQSQTNPSFLGRAPARWFLG